MPEIFHINGEYHFRPDPGHPKRVTVVHGDVTQDNNEVKIEEYDAPVTLVGRDAKVVIEDIPVEPRKPPKEPLKKRSVKRSGES